MQRFFKSAHYRKSEKEHLLSVWYSPLLFLLFFRGCRFCLFLSKSHSKGILVRLQPRSANSKWGTLKNRRRSKKKVPFRSSLKWFFLWSLFIFLFWKRFFVKSNTRGLCLFFGAFEIQSGWSLFRFFFQIISTCLGKIKEVFVLMIRCRFSSGRLLVRFGPYSADSFVENQSICGIAWIVYCIYR